MTVWVTVWGLLCRKWCCVSYINGELASGLLTLSDKSVKWSWGSSLYCFNCCCCRARNGGRGDHQHGRPRVWRGRLSHQHAARHRLRHSRCTGRSAGRRSVLMSCPQRLLCPEAGRWGPHWDPRLIALSSGSGRRVPSAHRAVLARGAKRRVSVSSRPRGGFRSCLAHKQWWPVHVHRVGINVRGQLSPRSAVAARLWRQPPVCRQSPSAFSASRHRPLGSWRAANGTGSPLTSAVGWTPALATLQLSEHALRLSDHLKTGLVKAALCYTVSRGYSKSKLRKCWSRLLYASLSAGGI